MAKIRVFLSNNSRENEQTFDIVSWIKSLAPHVEIDFCNRNEVDLPDFVKGSDGPIYEVSGFYLKGNPSPEQIRDILFLIMNSSVN